MDYLFAPISIFVSLTLRRFDRGCSSGRRDWCGRYGVRRLRLCPGRCGWLRGSGYRNAWCLGAGSAASERQQSDIARTLDGFAKPTLVTRAYAGHTPRENLAALLDKLRQDIGALVVDQVHLLNTEFADFFLAEKLALAATRTSGPTTRPSFATRAAVSATGTMSARPAMPATRPAVPAFATRRWTGCLLLFVRHLLPTFQI
jgi:hypothetical protein